MWSLKRTWWYGSIVWPYILIPCTTPIPMHLNLNISTRRQKLQDIRKWNVLKFAICLFIVSYLLPIYLILSQVCIFTFWTRTKKLYWYEICSVGDKTSLSKYCTQFYIDTIRENSRASWAGSKSSNHVCQKWTLYQSWEIAIINDNSLSL